MLGATPPQQARKRHHDGEKIISAEQALATADCEPDGYTARNAT